MNFWVSQLGQDKNSLFDITREDIWQSRFNDDPVHLKAIIQVLKNIKKIKKFYKDQDADLKLAEFDTEYIYYYIHNNAIIAHINLPAPNAINDNKGYGMYYLIKPF